MTAPVRLVARLDIKAPNLIKGVHLEGLRVVGSPREAAVRYYEMGADELLYIDIVASLYGRNSLSELVEETTSDVFIPLTVGGGIRSLKDVETLLRCGADKVSINTAATKRPEIITEVSARFGSQCMVLGIEAKRKPSGGWEAYTDNGREHTGLDPIEWARRGEDLGAGEILLTSVDQEGTRRGFDVELASRVTEAVSIPVILSGGLGDANHAVEAVKSGGVDAIAVADAIHYDRLTFDDLRETVDAAGIPVRLR